MRADAEDDERQQKKRQSLLQVTVLAGLPELGNRCGHLRLAALLALGRRPRVALGGALGFGFLGFLCLAGLFLLLLLVLRCLGLGQRLGGYGLGLFLRFGLRHRRVGAATCSLDRRPRSLA